MNFFFSPFIIPLGAFAMVICIVGIVTWHKNREKEIDYELRLREMEHQKKMKEMDLEMARLKAQKPEEPQSLNS
jgi:hypothetical protein